jgi:hypothetical protein
MGQTGGNNGELPGKEIAIDANVVAKPKNKMARN